MFFSLASRIHLVFLAFVKAECSRLGLTGNVFSLPFLAFSDSKALDTRTGKLCCWYSRWGVDVDSVSQQTIRMSIHVTVDTQQKFLSSCFYRPLVLQPGQKSLVRVYPCLRMCVGSAVSVFCCFFMYLTKHPRLKRVKRFVKPLHIYKVLWICVTQEWVRLVCIQDL